MFERRRFLPGFLLLAFSLLLPAGAPEATTVRRMALAEMVQRASDVVQARAVEQRVETDAKTLHHWTVTTFEILSTAKGRGQAGELMEIRVLGGEAPGSGYATVVADAPRFQVDEEVVLFSYLDRQQRRHLVGFFQGAVRLQPTPDGLVTRGIPADLTSEAHPPQPSRPAAGRRVGAPAAGPADPPPTPQTAPPVPVARQQARRGMPVEAFMERVRQLATLQEETP